MKCIKNNDGDIRRINDREAWDKVRKLGWMYVSKSEWKSQVRDINKKEVTVEVKIEKSDKAKRRSKFKTQ